MLAEPIKAILRYARNALKGFDMFCNTLMGGEPRETISERAARLRDKGVVYGCVMCRFLDIFQQDHCNKSRDRMPTNRGG